MDTHKIRPNMNAATRSTTLAPEGKFNSLMRCTSQLNPPSLVQDIVEPRRQR